MAGSVPMNRGTFARFLYPGINAIWGKAYSEHEKEFPVLFEKHTSTRAWEEDVGVSTFGQFKQLGEGEPISYDSEAQEFVTRYTHVQYGLGFIITQILYEDDQYDVVAERRGSALAFSFNQTMETIAANVYNRAFDTNYVGGDGKPMCSATHPSRAGTWSNVATASTDLSEAAIEQACIDIMKWTDSRGNKISVMPVSLHTAPDEIFNAERILNSTLRVGTANNDINAIKSMGKFRNGVAVNHYFSDANAWFIRTNMPNGLKHFERRPVSFDVDNDHDTGNAKFKATWRGSFGWTDPRCIWGNPGA